MNVPKPLLGLGGKLLLARVADTLKSICREQIIVVRPGQEDDIPDLGIALGMHVITDLPGYDGPMSGMAAGLKASTTPLAFVIGADYPFLSRALILEMMRRSQVGNAEGYSAVFIRHPNGVNPLHAVYPASPWTQLFAEALAGGVLSPMAVVLAAIDADEHPVQIMTEDEVERIDPRLLSLLDVDTLDDLSASKRIIDTRFHRVRPDLKRGGI